MNDRVVRLLRAPLHIHVASLFVLLVVMVGGLLAFNQYRSTSRILLDSSDQLTELMARFIQSDIKVRQSTAVASINMARRNDLVLAQDWTARQRALPWLQQELHNHKLISGFIVGYPDGDSLVAHPTITKKQKARYGAPPHSDIAVDHIDWQDGRQIDAHRYFFDVDLNLIRTQPLAEAAYDPRTRPWYQQAMATNNVVLTEPYPFFISRTVGITIARQAADGVVVAVDYPLDTLSGLLKSLELPPGSDIVLFDRQNQVIAYLDKADMTPYVSDNQLRARRLHELSSPVIQHVAPLLPGWQGRQNFDFQGETWVSEVLDVGVIESLPLKLAVLIPESELMRDALALRKQSAVIGLLILLVSLPVAWLLSRLVSTPLRQLERDTAAIRQFRFDQVVDTRSIVLEIDRLGKSINLMSTTIEHFLQMIGSLAEEKELDVLLSKVAAETRATSGADAALLLLFSEDRAVLEVRSLSAGDGARSINPEQLPALPVSEPWLASILQNQDIEQREWNASSALCQTVQRILYEPGEEGAQVVLMPLVNRDRKNVGVLCMVFRTDGKSLQQSAKIHSRLPFISELSGFAAVSVETRQLILHQKKLFSAFIELIAGAIDAKSPYTGGHCQRVPELTEMLARAACAATEPPFDRFNLNEEEWEALHVAGWLHDCGKVTTPEQVVDKATKLECRYDRIHEIRMRFELLKCMAERDYWRDRVEGRQDASGWQALQQLWAQLDEEFAFVGRCNVGGEFLPQQDIDRLQQIGQRRWTRTLSDRIGISWEEAQRKQQQPEPQLPVQESLLADRPDHRIPRDASSHARTSSSGAFNLVPPPDQYNLGELYNLGIAKGTLTAEERFLINDHIVQTIIMLEKLPYPDHLKAVPDIAGGHHEKMDGTGYPKGLKAADMPLTARMMAIADIFEALTAADRPYKTPKTLSESLAIMQRMAAEQHIDPALFRLFIRAGVYREYAERFLLPEQIDPVDEAALTA